MSKCDVAHVRVCKLSNGLCYMVPFPGGGGGGKGVRYGMLSHHVSNTEHMTFKFITIDACISI